MKSLSERIYERLIVNKNYKNPTQNWQIINDAPGEYWFACDDYDDDFLHDMFYSTCEHKPLPNKIAWQRFIDNDEPVLTTFVDSDNNDNYIVYGWDKKTFGGRFAMWFVEYENKKKLSLNVYFSNKMTARISSYIYTENEKQTNFAIHEDDFDNIIKRYLEIENTAK